METKNNILENIKVKKEMPMDAAYFEQFSAQMMQEIKKHPRAKVFYLKPLFWAISSAAAAILILLTLNINNSNKPTLSRLSSEEIKNYIQENEDEITVEELPEIDVKSQSVIKDKPILKQENIPDKNVEIASLEGYKSSDEILNELSVDEIYSYVNSEDFDIEEIDITQ